MKQTGLATLALTAALLAVPASAAPKVLETEFFFVEGGYVTVSNLVPLVPDDVCFEWRLKLDVPDGPVEFTEVMVLPAAPEFWKVEPEVDHEISGDGTVSTTTDVDKIVGGWLHHGWCVAQGDPLGDYRIGVTVDGTLLHTFGFKLIEPGTLYL